MTDTTTLRPAPRHDVTTALHSDGHHYATCSCRWHSLPVQDDHAAMVAAGRHLQGQTSTGRWTQNTTTFMLLTAGAFLFGAAIISPDVRASLLGILILVAIVAAYLLPTLIAGSRKYHNIGTVAVVNIFLGWTFIGWVVALAMAASAVRSADRL